MNEIARLCLQLTLWVLAHPDSARGLPLIRWSVVSGERLVIFADPTRVTVLDARGSMTRWTGPCDVCNDGGCPACDLSETSPIIQCHT